MESSWYIELDRFDWHYPRNLRRAVCGQLLRLSGIYPSMVCHRLPGLPYLSLFQGQVAFND